MNRPLYKESDGATLGPHGHRGLWFDRFFHGYQVTWTLANDAKLAWIKEVTKDRIEEPVISKSATRLRQLCQSMGGTTRNYTASWYFVSGMGNPHPVENGFLWHPTLGTPYINGAAIKGLVRAWVEAWMPFEDETERPATLRRWFGSEDKNPEERQRLRNNDLDPPTDDRKLDTEAGAFIFFDALPIYPVTLKADVMTPHMGNWYAKGGQLTSVETQSDCVPADWHKPIPVPFLVAVKPEFQFCIAPRREAAQDDLPRLFEALQAALEYLGSGAKTAAGYGRLTRTQAIGE